MKKDKENKPVTTTHSIGMGVTNPTDAISKVVHICRGDNKCFQIAFITVWAEGDEPMVTKVTLSDEAMFLLSDTLNEFILNHSKYKRKDATMQSQAHRTNDQ
jgi:hypothetical protein